MKTIEQKSLDKLEDALNHLGKMSDLLVKDKDTEFIEANKEAFDELKSAMDLMFEVIDPLR